MVKVAGYCRVSTDQDDQANSLDNQRRYFREYIQNQPYWQLHEIYADEGITGTSTKKRTQFNRMMSDAYAGKFRMIVTKEVSRFSRNILDTIRYTRELRAMGIGVLFLNDGINTMEPDSELRLSIMGSIAQEESRRTSSRVVWGQTRQMEKGVVFGKSLLGYDVKDGVLTVNELGAEVVRLIFHKYAAEMVSASKIAEYLTNQGYGGSVSWTAGRIIKILKNEKYVGDLVQKKTFTPDYLTHEKRNNRGEVPFVTIENHHEQIISRELWNLAQERLRKNNKHGDGDGGHSNRYVFSGRIKCGECGSSFVGRFRYMKDGTRIRRWCCGTATRCGVQSCNVGKLIRDDDAMQMLQKAVRSIPLDIQAVIRDVTDLAMEAIGAEENCSRAECNRNRYEIKQIQKKKEAVLDSYFSGEITKEDMVTMKRKYDDRLEQLILGREEAIRAQTDFAAVRTEIQAELAAILDGSVISEVFSKTVLESFTVFRDRHMELKLRHLPQVFRFSD